MIKPENIIFAFKFSNFKINMKSTRVRKSGLVSRLITPVALGIGSLLYMGTPKEAPAQDLVRYVVPTSDPVANLDAWRAASLDLYNTPTTGTKTIYLGRGIYKSSPLPFPRGLPTHDGVRHIGLGEVPFSLDNSDDDATTGVFALSTGYTPGRDSYFENIVFKPMVYIGSHINLMRRNISFNRCAFMGDEVEGRTCISNSPGQAMPGERVHSLEDCKIRRYNIGISTYSGTILRGTRVCRSNVAISTSARVLDGIVSNSNKPNVIDLAGAATNKPKFLAINPTLSGIAEESDATTKDGVVEEFFLTLELYNPEGKPVIDLEEAYQYFKDFRTTRGTPSTRTNPFPSDVHIQLINPEPPTSAKGWEHY